MKEAMKNVGMMIRKETKDWIKGLDGGWDFL